MGTCNTAASKNRRYFESERMRLMVVFLLLVGQAFAFTLPRKVDEPFGGLLQTLSKAGYDDPYTFSRFNRMMRHRRAEDGNVDHEEFQRIYRGDQPAYVNNYANAVMRGLG